MVKSKDNVSWRRLCVKHNADFALTDRELPAMGNLFLDMTTKWLVSIYAMRDGLIVGRLPFSGIFPVAKILWTNIKTVTEYYCRVSEKQGAETQSYCFVTFRQNELPSMIVPWRSEFNDLLPDSIDFIDNKSVDWQTEMSTIFGEHL